MAVGQSRHRTPTSPVTSLGLTGEKRINRQQWSLQPSEPLRGGVSVRAELAGKLSMSSPSRQDRLEDTLTDGVFSSLRYLPRDVLTAWLRTVLPPSTWPHVTEAAAETAQFEF